MTNELLALWAPQDEASNPGEYEIRRKLGESYAAVSPSGTPSLLVPLEDSSPGRGRVLGSIRLRYEPNVAFKVDGSTWTQRAAVIDCVDLGVVRTFAHVIADIVEQLSGDQPTSRTIAQALAAWDDLLRRRAPLDAASELGLWGELVIFDLVDDPDALLAAWRGPENKTFDFLAGGVGLECKTSTTRRRHTISYRQAAYQADNVTCYLASVWADEDPARGSTLPDRIDQLRDKIVDEGALLRKLLSAGYRDEHRHEYGRRFSLQSEVALFDMRRIPQVREYDDGVSSIRYDIDLTRTPTINSTERARLLRQLTRIPQK